MAKIVRKMILLVEFSSFFEFYTTKNKYIDLF